MTSTNSVFHHLANWSRALMHPCSAVVRCAAPLQRADFAWRAQVQVGQARCTLGVTRNLGCRQPIRWHVQTIVARHAQRPIGRATHFAVGGSAGVDHKRLLWLGNRRLEVAASCAQALHHTAQQCQGVVGAVCHGPGPAGRRAGACLRGPPRVELGRLAELRSWHWVNHLRAMLGHVTREVPERLVRCDGLVRQRHGDVAGKSLWRGISCG